MPDRVRVPAESRRGHQIPWKLEFQAVVSWLMLVLEKQLVLCTAEPLFTPALSGACGLAEVKGGHVAVALTSRLWAVFGGHWH